VLDPENLRSTWERGGTQLSFEDFSAKFCKWMTDKQHVASAQTLWQGFVLKSQRDAMDSNSKTFALACYSEIPDNSLMWSHYTDGHRGIVVGFNVKNSFFAPNLMSVSYRSERVTMKYEIDRFTFDEHALSVVRTKSLDWSYEREWRQLFRVNDCTKIHNHDGTTCFYVSIPSDAIASVIFGVRCRPETERIVRDLKSERICNICVCHEQCCMSVTSR
jgi:hypothetical protein